MRIVHVINNLPVGGAERFVLDLAAAQARAGADPMLVTLATPNPLAAEAEHRGIPVHAIDRRRLDDPRILFAARSALAALDPTVVHTHLFYADFFGRAAARIAAVPAVVSTEHSTEGDRLSRRRLWAMRLSARWADRFVAVSQPVRDAAVRRLGVAPSMFEIIPNGVDLATIAAARPLSRDAFGIADGCLIVGCIGRLVESKQFAAVLDAVATLPQCAVLIAGDGPERAALEERAARLRIGDRVQFLGVRHDVPALLHLLDIFCLPSRYEGHSVALLEAMAAGRACIVSNIAEFESVAGTAAIAVPPGDAAAIAAALRTLGDSAQRRALGAQAAGIAAQYDIDSVAARYLRVYDEVLARKGARHR